MSAVLDRSAAAAPAVRPASAPAVASPPATPAIPPDAPPLAPPRPPSALRHRVLLVLGCVAAAAAAWTVGDPAPFERADPELARLLRGMAAIKFGAVLAAVGVLAWRFGRPVPPRSAAVYLAGTWLIAAASVLIWQLTHLAGAALAFHVGALALLGVAWCDGGAAARRRRPVG